jgi:hypothetical protein
MSHLLGPYSDAGFFPPQHHIFSLSFNVTLIRTSEVKGEFLFDAIRTPERAAS